MPPSSPIIIKNSGMLSSIQDSGRIGFRRLAIPQSGFIDPDSALLANYLVNNTANTPTLENIGGYTFKITCPCSLGIFGTNAVVLKNGTPISLGRTIEAQEDDQFVIKGGVSYLAVPGGFLKTNLHFKSRSTYPLAKLGGIQGKYLEKGSRLEFSNSERSESVIPSDLFPQNHDRIRIIQGPEFQGSEKEFSDLRWSISSASNRVGIKLEGNSWPRSQDEMKPVPVFPGTIQLPPSGQPIILLQDAQTTGGYPRIGQIIKADLPRIGRMITGGTIKFTFVEISEAKDILERKNAFIKYALEKSDQ